VRHIYMYFAGYNVIADVFQGGEDCFVGAPCCNDIGLAST